jgi:hypothetical protein
MESAQHREGNRQRVRTEGRWYNDVIAFFTIVLAISTIGLWISTHGLYKAGEAQREHSESVATQQARDMQASIIEARRAASAAEHALVATNRPWVTVRISPLALTYGEDGLRLKLLFALKNIGRSPATRVWINCELLTTNLSAMFAGQPEPMIHPPARQQEIIAEVKDPGRNRMLGFALFPEEEALQEYQLSVNAERLAQVTHSAEFLSMTLVGVVEYRSGFSATSHATGFIRDLQRDNRPRPVSTDKNRSPAAIFPDEGDIPGEDLRLIDPVIGGGYAD